MLKTPVVIVVVSPHATGTLKKHMFWGNGTSTADTKSKQWLTARVICINYSGSTSLRKAVEESMTGKLEDGGCLLLDDGVIKLA